MDGTEGSLVDVPGGRVWVRRWEAGGPERPPILLLHDSLGSVEQWRDFPEALAAAASRPVLAYDRLGFGRSSPRAGRPSFAFVAEEAEGVFPALREALGIGDFALFGHSVGGAMALAIAAAHRGCEAVVTECAQAFVEERTLAGIREARARFQDPAAFARLERYHGDKARWVLDAWTEVWLAEGFRDWNLDAVLPRVTCPILAIHGEGDPFGSSAFPRRIVTGAGGLAASVLLGGCAHVPHRERRAEVLRLAAGFLECT